MQCNYSTNCNFVFTIRFWQAGRGAIYKVRTVNSNPLQLRLWLTTPQPCFNVWFNSTWIFSSTYVLKLRFNIPKPASLTAVVMSVRDCLWVNCWPPNPQVHQSYPSVKEELREVSEDLSHRLSLDDCIPPPRKRLLQELLKLCSSFGVTQFIDLSLHDDFTLGGRCRCVVG